MIGMITPCFKVMQFCWIECSLTQNMSYSIHQVSLASCLTLYHCPLCQDKARHHWVLLAQEEVHHLQARCDALWECPTNDCVIATHCLQDHAHIANGTPLDCKPR